MVDEEVSCFLIQIGECGLCLHSMPMPVSAAFFFLHSFTIK